jgi:hypothetical protein
MPDLIGIALAWASGFAAGMLFLDWLNRRRKRASVGYVVVRKTCQSCGGAGTIAYGQGTQPYTCPVCEGTKYELTEVPLRN